MTTHANSEKSKGGGCLGRTGSRWADLLYSIGGKSAKSAMPVLLVEKCKNVMLPTIFVIFRAD
ncbi:hypothetical protein GJA_4748 [Janthinobacterium agaricidamnosum NBRC 102515 = DSM 9628]|uniref:Uncharacterized protein n=1 Tax=Janthinobacterium agaricidamnosum NBRC 102515 = DSM 9628 TaxID=1349767 RepID=W0VDG7_9BURK|nr:hypothetical protein GJA_4748 [Janthinobacterium agaricidamnosum NBRC 102515 = DSM 9628]